MTTTIARRGTKRPPVPGTPVAMNGAALVAHAMRQVRPDVVAAYPITPQTVITETFSEFVANGRVHTEFVPVESEHAAMSACIGAACAGARVQTATSGPGLALMWEVLGIASGLRLPIVMHLCTRALSAPIDILCDHSDAMAMRETGWVMLVGENVQEAYDNAIMAVKIAEDPRVSLPVANLLDGFVVTHCMERAELLPDDAVTEFVGEYSPTHPLLDLQHPVTVGALDFHDYYMEHRRQQEEGMANAKQAVEHAAREFASLFGRSYGLLDTYQLEDAEVAMVVIGSAAGTLRMVVDGLRREGVRAGLLRVRCLRPFPSQEVANALKGVQRIGVLDRSLALGAAGEPLWSDVVAALATHGAGHPVTGWVYGVGGRNTPPGQFRQAFLALLDPATQPGRAGYLGLRERR
ncbi:MAG: pyruvate ferredoxin oxidoreductase [Chloroflexi bacterium]|nr:pyruvate ferredoxin oxidoreductase [Chloroflexota bacterium]